jgi:hypothetical protein
MSVRFQEFLHKYEEGAGYRYLTYVLGLFVMVMVAGGYDLMTFRNMSTREGMDAAQLARNIAEGRGYTTEFIRPFDLFLLKRHQLARELHRSPAPAQTTNEAAGPKDKNWARLSGQHPDLANPPLYPLLLAGALKLMPFDFPELKGGEPFRVYAPDQWIAGVNQVLLILSIIAVFWVARKLFDEAVAWVAASVTLGADLLWRFSLSGLSTLLAILLFATLAGVLAKLDLAARAGDKSTARLTLLAALAGTLAGLASLTRYSLAWMMIPVLFFLGSLPHAARMRFVLAALIPAAALVSPWLARNFHISGTPFGTAGYAIYQGTSQFAGIDLERMLSPDFSLYGATDFWIKLLTNGRELLVNDLPRLGGSWVSALFLTGLLVPFRSPTIARMRWYVVGCLAILSLVQVLGHSGSPAPSAEVSADNLLVIAAPVAFIFGISLLFNLLEQFLMPAVRSPITVIMCVLAALPLLLSFVLPSPSPLIYPPYYPPWIQAKARWIEKQEWLAADIPWAVAWYGHRQSVWLPLKYGSRHSGHEDFYALDRLQPLQGLYLTTHTLKTLDAQSIAAWRETVSEDRDWNKFTSLVRSLADKPAPNPSPGQWLAGLQELYNMAQLHWIRGGGEDWESFVVGVMINQEVPTGFPLKWAPAGLWPEIFLTDSERGG